MRVIKKTIIYIAYVFSYIFYPKYGKLIIRFWGFQGAWWIVNSVWFQKLLGFNRNAPYPINFSSRVSNYKNLIVPGSSINSLQAPGVYYQNFSAKIILGENVYIAPNVGLITANHDFKELQTHQEGKNIEIKDNCWIGMNSVIMPGVILGKNTIVGAGSVVTKSFEEGNIVIGGVPAKIIKSL